MKTVTKSIPVRILTALGGLVLLALAALAVAEGFFGVPVTASVAGMLSAGGALAVLLRIVGVLALLVLTGCCVVCALPTRQPRQTGSIMQKGENGPIGVTVGSIEKMVLACAAKHPEILHTDVDVREMREGIVLLMDVQQVGGVSIPLSIARLQKQVREYVTARTGLDVIEVRVMVDNADDEHVRSEFEVEDTVVPSVPVRTEEFAPVAAPAAEPVVEKLAQLAEITSQPVPEELPEEIPAEPAVDLPREEVDLDKLLPVTEAAPILVDEDERPLHQRVFGAEEMPHVIPMPPQMVPAPMAEEAAPAAEEAAEEEAARPAETPAPQPAEEVQDDWTDPSMQAAAEEMLTADVTAQADAEDDAEAEAEADAVCEADEETEETEPLM